MMNFSDTKRLVLGTLGLSFLTQIFGLLSSVIVARQLGAEGRGIFALFLAALLISTTIPGFLYGGVELLIAYRRKIILSFHSLAFYAGFVSSIFSAIVLFGLDNDAGSRFFGANENYVKYFFIFCTFLAVSYEVLKKTIIGLGDVAVVQRNSLISSLIVPVGVSLISSFSVIQINHLFWLILISYLYMLFSTSRSVRRNISTHFHLQDGNFKLYNLGDYLKDGIRYSITTIPIGIYLKMDVLIVGALMSVSDVGVYSIAVTIAGMLMLLPRVLNMIIRSSGHDFGKDSIAVISAGKLVFVIAIFSSVFLFFTGNRLFAMIFGPEFGNSGAIAAYLCVAFGFLGYAEVLGAYVDIKGEYRKSLALLIWVGLFFSACILYVACYLFGVGGMAICLIIAYFIKFLAFGFTFSRLTNSSIVDLFRPVISLQTT